MTQKATIPTNVLRVSAVVAVAMLSVSPVAEAAVVVADRSTDNVLQGNFESGAPAVFLTNNSNARRVGTGGAAADTRVNQPVLGFALPAIPAGEKISAAVFGFTMDTVAISGGTLPFDLVISLMSQTSVTGFSAADFTEDSGSLGAGTFVATVTQGDVGNDSVETFSLSGAALTQIAGLYDLNGAPSQAEVFFRLSTSATLDATDDANNNMRFNFARNDTGGGNLVSRSLEFTTEAIPEPSVFALLGLAVLGLFARRR